MNIYPFPSNELGLLLRPNGLAHHPAHLEVHIIAIDRSHG